MTAFFGLVIIISAFGCYASQKVPAIVSPAVITEETSGSCPSSEMLETLKNTTKTEIKNILRDTVIPTLDAPSTVISQPPCACGGPGQWTRIAHLNMSAPNQQCPASWNLITTPVRGCGRSSSGQSLCDSASFPSNHRSYTRVCGRVIAYQRGSTDAFDASITGQFGTITNPGLEHAYLDGLSLTHGAAGSRQHIWSFAAALYETDPSLRQHAICSCTNTDISWPYQVPSFVGNDYFCATGNPGPSWVDGQVYPDDPLWDGEGCGPTNACCQFNTPPWFCTTVQPTTNDLEMRICADQHNINNEDVIVELIDIYIM